MGSSHFGDLSLEGGRSSSGSSSRRGRKSNSDKPKQPQRGLGVAQLEKIRLHNQIGGGYLPSFHGPFHSNLEQNGTVELPFLSSSSSSSSSKAASSSPFLHGLRNITMGFGKMERRDHRSMDSQSNATASITWDGQQSAQPPPTLPLLRETLMEDWVQKKRRHDPCYSMDSSSQNSNSSNPQELDLDLKLSI